MVIVQRVVPHYRVAFLDGLHDRLWRSLGVELVIIYGQERAGTVPRSEVYERPWSVRIVNRYLRVGETDLTWQPCLSWMAGADLVVVEQANRLLLNYLLIARRSVGLGRLAFWGHGRNLQRAVGGGFRETWKRLTVANVDWWFAYTEHTRQYLRGVGVPSARITVVNNAIDTAELSQAAVSLQDRELYALRTGLGIRSERVGVYCGGIYPGKRLDFLIEAGDRIRSDLGDFELVVVGDGPSASFIVDASVSRSWLHYVGARFGRDRVPYLQLGKLMMMPGPVGLVILDCFALGIPLFTTDLATHGPEIAYLQAGINGVMTANNTRAYADAVVAYFGDPDQQAALAGGCLESARRYTLEGMVDRFADGIMRCLAT